MAPKRTDAPRLITTRVPRSMRRFPSTVHGAHGVRSGARSPGPARLLLFPGFFCDHDCRDNDVLHDLDFKKKMPDGAVNLHKVTQVTWDIADGEGRCSRTTN